MDIIICQLKGAHEFFVTVHLPLVKCSTQTFLFLKVTTIVLSLETRIEPGTLVTLGN